MMTAAVMCRAGGIKRSDRYVLLEYRDMDAIDVVLAENRQYVQ